MVININMRVLAHSFQRFYMVTKFILPSIGDLKFCTLNYDNTCAYLCDTYGNSAI